MEELTAEQEEEIEKEFGELIGELNDNQFWRYIQSWKNEQDLLDIMTNWDTEIKKEEIKVLKEIIKNEL